MRFFMMFFIFIPCWWSWSEIPPHCSWNSLKQDTIIYFPGFFQWDEGTVVQTSSSLSDNIVHYLEILDHVNVDFSESPESVVLISKNSKDDLRYEIRVSEDTIRVSAPQTGSIESALRYLLNLKKNAENRSPDYGLIYIRCGLYRFEEF